MDNDTSRSNVQLSEEEIKVFVDFFSVLIEIEQDLKKKGISLDDIE